MVTANVLIFPQPSSHASPGSCGGTENSKVLKISTTKNEVLSTIWQHFIHWKLNAWQHFLKCFWDHLQIFSNWKWRPGNSFSGPQALWEQGWEGNVTSPKRAGPASLNKHVIMNRHGSHNIRNEIEWAQTGHSTGTCTATLLVVELWIHQKFESFKNIIFRRNSNSNLLINSKNTRNRLN